MAFQDFQHKVDENGKWYCFICRKKSKKACPNDTNGRGFCGEGNAYRCPDSYIRNKYPANQLRDDLACNNSNMATKPPKEEKPTIITLRDLITQQALQLSQFQQAAATADATQNQTLTRLEQSRVTPVAPPNSNLLLLLIVGAIAFLWFKSR